MNFWSPVQKIIRIQNTTLVVIALFILGIVCCLDWKAVSTPDIMKKMIVSKLKDELRKRGIDSTGTRPVLIENARASHAKGRRGSHGEAV